MSKKKNKRRGQSGSSFIIPVVAGLVLVAVVVGVIALNEARRSPTGQAGASGAVATALPLSSQSIPNPDVPRISVQEAKAQLDGGQALLVDVRSASSYEKSHAVGAVSIPEETIASRLQELPRDKEIILYCT